MGRAGSGHSGGGHSSGGGHRSSHSGGGHRVGSSGGGSGRRAMGGSPRPGSSRGPGPMGGGFRGPGRPPGGGMYPPPPPPRRRYRRGYYGGGSGGGCFSGCFTVILVLIILMVISGPFFRMSGGSSNSSRSTIVREKLQSGNAYRNDCIIDEIGWFDNVSRTAGRLQNFWEQTGVQPYIILRAYDPSLSSDAQKDAWASTYYDDHFDAENIFLFVYFAEQDVDNDVGYMCYSNGYETSSVMDSEAVEIFWNYIDQYWYSDLSTDDLFVKVFDKTADTIMHTSATKYDAYRWIGIAVAVIAFGIILITVIRMVHRRKKEEAEEAERILNTPLEEMMDDK